MNRHPFDSHELGRGEPELDRVGQALERYAADEGGEPPLDLASRIRSAVDAEPEARGPFAVLLATWRRPVRLLAAAVVVLAAVVGAVALGELADRARNPDIGTSPSPSIVTTPPPTPTPTPTLVPTPSPSPSPSVTPTETPSDTPEPTATDGDDGVETPEPSESESDNSGPGGGGGSDNSGPGSGGDDSG